MAVDVGCISFLSGKLSNLILVVHEQVYSSIKRGEILFSAIFLEAVGHGF